MFRRRSLFLLEIVIAMVLVGFFSVYFLRSSLQYLYREREGLLELEFERVCNLRRMDVIADCWQTIEALPQKKTEAKVFDKKLDSVLFGGKEYTPRLIIKAWRAGTKGKCYNLVLEEQSKPKEGKKYHFLVKKEDAKA